jgi:hypothetical protein
MTRIDHNRTAYLSHQINLPNLNSGLKPVQMQEKIAANSKRAKPTYTVQNNSMEDSAASGEECLACL